MADDDFAGERSRLPMKPNSRSPWADWFRFMKSMSIVDQGRSRIELRVQVQAAASEAPSARGSTSWTARRCASTG